MMRRSETAGLSATLISMSTSGLERALPTFTVAVPLWLAMATKRNSAMQRRRTVAVRGMEHVGERWLLGPNLDIHSTSMCVGCWPVGVGTNRSPEAYL